MEGRRLRLIELETGEFYLTENTSFYTKLGAFGRKIRCGRKLNGKGFNSIFTNGRAEPNDPGAFRN